MHSTPFAQSRLVRVLAALTIAFGFASLANADIDKVNGLLRRAETNLASVTASIGQRTTPPQGSSAKLAANRLKQVIDDLTPAKALLDQIPVGTQGRDEAAGRHAKALEEYNRLQRILTGSDTPAMPADTSGTKLDYQQEELLKNARFHLREVDGNARQLTERTEILRKVEDQLTVDFREVIALRGVVENAQRKTGFATDALDKLPPDGAGVADIRRQVAEAAAKVSAAAGYLDPLHARLQDLINPANYPEFEADRKRLAELSVMFRDAQILQTNPTLAAETFQQATPAKDECVRIAQRYARLIQQQTEQGKAIEGVGNSFLRSHAAFLAESDIRKAALPADIRNGLQTAVQQAAEAVAKQMPRWFTGGIPQTMLNVEERVALLEAIDPDEGKELRAELDQTAAGLKQQADSLRELIIRENRVPADRYVGPDRDAAIKTALSAWKIQQDDFKLLKTSIPAEQWSRETKWTFSNGTWYFSDRSRLQVRLIVADHDNPELAIDRPINVWKDHQNGDSMYGTPLFGFDHELQPSDYLLRSNVK